MTMIVCESVRKTYRGHIAVNDVTLRISGGLCAILGPNGAGKSTLLKMMTGLETPDAGSIQIGGLDVVKDARRVKQRIGVLPDQLGLFESLTVSENLQCVGPIYGLSEREAEMRTTALLKLLDLESGRNTFASECSYGMRKKTALAMAMLHGPEVLVLDEPFEGIDPSSSRAIERTLQNAAAKGVTVLLTSHILSLVERVASRVVILGAGDVVWDSSEDKLEGSLEAKYFELAGEPGRQELPWLAC
jgi:ABC-2 type transport system ATP-binding protein